MLGRVRQAEPARQCGPRQSLGPREESTYFLPMQYSVASERRKMAPSDATGVARIVSSMMLAASTLALSPASMTVRNALFVDEIELAVGEQRRGGEGAFQPVRPENRAGLGAGAVDDAAAVDDVNQALVDDGRAIIGTQLDLLPEDFRLGHVLAGRRAMNFSAAA